MTEPQEAEVFLDAELVIQTRTDALDRVIANYNLAEVSITGTTLPEVLGEAKKIENYLLNGEIPTA